MRYDIRDTKYGFTIAELLLVVVIITLIGGVGGGLYVGSYKRMLVEKAARDFVLTAKYARVMAIEKQKPYKMRLDVDNGRFLLTTSEWNEQTEQTESVIVRDLYCKPVTFEGDVQFENIKVASIGFDETFDTEQTEEAERTISFLPTGTAQSAVIQIGDGTTHYTITISSATGKAKIYFGTTENVKAATIDLDER